MALYGRPVVIGRSMSFDTWPIAFANLVAIAVVAAALVQSWRSADRVVHANRKWTRAWRLSVALFGVTLFGLALPFGAIYALLAYTRPAHRVRSRVSVP
jgi:hypothetical protein